jgi:cell fate regulator YaaT (PSP1 superfamily)
MPQTVEVRFKGTRKAYFLWPEEQERLHLHEAVVVEAEKGLDFGRITAVGETAEKKCAGACNGCAVGESKSAETAVVRNVVRRASQADIKTANDLRRTEETDRQRIVGKTRDFKLAMKISDAEWQWDRSRLTVYFTADERVDFRGLVRDMATMFRTRIELRQIGVRDEAARIGGVGRCGKEFCCSTWLTELSPVSLALAKDQHLSLNPSQISGGCGRLLCCLKYEHEFYVASRKRFPKEGKLVPTARGPEKVVAVDIFRERVFLRHPEQGPRVISLIELHEEMAANGGVIAVAPPPTALGAPGPDRVRRGGGPGGRSAQAPPPPRPGPPSPEVTPAPAPEQAAAPDGALRKKRRRRRRRGGGGGTPGTTPSSEGPGVNDAPDGPDTGEDDGPDDGPE